MRQRMLNTVLLIVPSVFCISCYVFAQKPKHSLLPAPQNIVIGTHQHTKAAPFLRRTPLIKTEAPLNNDPSNASNPSLFRIPPIEGLESRTSMNSISGNIDAIDVIPIPYQKRRKTLVPKKSERISTPRIEINSSTKIPEGYIPWWQAKTLEPLRNSREVIAIDTNSLIIDALRHSAKVRAISDNAVISQFAITRADAEFDTLAFMESKLVRTSVPTGSTLDAGVDVPRLREEDWFFKTGVRRKNHYGGRLEIAQQIGVKDSNSQFFLPANQGNSRLTLSYNHPLLNGAGQAYNNSLIILADIDMQIASNRMKSELQDHLLAVTLAMWELYQQRTTLLQKQRHLERAQEILTHLIKRRAIDSLKSQIARARAAVSMRRAELIRAEASIRNAETQVRSLVNSPSMLSNRKSEMIPIQSPMNDFIPISIEDAVLTALENRPEIDVVSNEIEAARIRLQVSKNDLLPVLDLVMETYVSGLQGNERIGGSWVDQFSVGEPSHTAGFVFEVPIHQRAAKADHQRRQVELRQLSSRLQLAVETLHAEVEVAVREVETAYHEMQAIYSSMVAAEEDVRYMRRRWEELPGDDRAVSFLLAELLDGQDRLVVEEAAFAQAQINYTLSLTQLNRATGMLLKQEQIILVKENEDDLPRINFEKKQVALKRLPPNIHD